MTRKLSLLSQEELIRTLFPPTLSPSQAPESAEGNVTLLSTLSRDEILQHIHHPGSTLPLVPLPSVFVLGSDTKTHWTAEGLHRAHGCRRFKNYKHLLQTSRDGQWVEVEAGEFPIALGSYVHSEVET